VSEAPLPAQPEPPETGAPPPPPALPSSPADPSPEAEAGPPPPSDRRLREAPWALLVLALAVALIYSQFRPIDSDEGFYASAIHLVANGQIPHRDFFSTQTPLQPYLYAPVELLSGRSLFALRLLSVAFLGLAFAALIAWAKRRLPPAAALLASGVLVSSAGLLSWSVCVKTYAGLNALLALALLLLWRACESERKGTFLAAGAVLGLATGVRLFGVVPWGAFGLVCLACSLRGPQRALARRALVPLAAGFLLGLLPTLALAAMSPEATYFGVWRYHQLRSVYPSLVVRAKNLVALSFKIALVQPQLALLVCLALAGVLRLKRTWGELPPGERLFWLGAAGILAAYSAANATPWPVFPQYFTATLPIFLFPFAGLACVPLAQRKRSAILVAALALGGAAYGLPSGAQRWASHPRWDPQSYGLLTGHIAALTPPGGRVVSFWPGHTYGAGAEFYPDAVNDFSLFVAPKVSPEERARFHLFGPEELIASLSGPQRAEVFVADPEPPGFRQTMTPEQFRRLKQALVRGYRFATHVDGVRVLVRNDLPAGD
jgi:dolichyl-phosphate-mannose-protein mannosyltransferase